MEFSEQEYQELAKTTAKKSPIVKDCLNAFLFGGTICLIGQGLLNWYLWLGLSETLAPTAVSMSLVLLSAILTGFSVYDDLAKYGGAGTLVPITGFANAVVSPAMEFKTEGFVTGMAAKMFTIAGPVIVVGTSASVISGVIYWIGFHL